MTRKEAERLTRQVDVLRSLGFTAEQAEQLRRISMTLHRWHELECGTDHGCVERDEQTGKPFWSSSHVPHRRAIPDRERGAIKRLDAILEERNKRHVAPGSAQTALGYFIQTDPRGAALYILRPGDVPAGADVSAHYNRGICVY